MRIVGCRANAKTAAESAHPCVVPTSVVNVWMVCSLSVQKFVVGRVYHVCVRQCRVWHVVAVALRIDVRGIDVKASVKSRCMSVCCGLVW